MVCRDVRGGSYEIPQLILSTPEEKKLYEIGKGGSCGFRLLSCSFMRPLGHRIPRETTDRVQNGVDAGPSNVRRGRSAPFVLSEGGSIRRCVHPFSFQSAGARVDVGHPNREIATHVSSKQKRALQNLRRCASRPELLISVPTLFVSFPRRLSDAPGVRTRICQRHAFLPPARPVLVPG
jgi:hypothetical protein